MKSSIIKNLAYALRKNSLETKLEMKMETMESPLKSSIISNLAYVLRKNTLETKLEMKMETMECTIKIFRHKQLSVRTKKK